MCWTVLCYHPYLVSMLFADLLSLLLVTSLMSSILVHLTFFSSRWMLELTFAIYYWAASLPHRLPMQCWLKNHWPDQAFFKQSPHTNSIPNSVILHNNYISLLSDSCACVHVKKKWRRQGSHSSSVESPRVTSNLEESDGLVHCSVKNAAVLCENHCERVMQILN